MFKQLKKVAANIKMTRKMVKLNKKVDRYSMNRSTPEEMMNKAMNNIRSK